ncbi:MAG: repeat containing protein [Cyanobacteria bacterium RYN_339]|nr:repeat containing protein [Cyanobacteria bacterium RYN_339]
MRRLTRGSIALASVCRWIGASVRPFARHFGLAHGALTWFVALALLSGCPGKSPVTPTSTKAPSPAASTTTTSATPTPPLLASPTPGPIGASPTAAPSIAPPTVASLTGIVRVPVYIVSTSGSGIISNNGAAIISDAGSGIVSTSGSGIVSTSGSGYHVAAAPEQLPLVGAKAVLYTAAGTKVAEATTDAKGQYAFTNALDPHNMILKVELPNGLGTLSAIAPKSAKSTDIDLVSSLTTTYIVDRYVATQTGLDAVTILDKLPADVEATTRATTATALTAGPDRLTADKVVAAVTSLRQQDAALDRQLEAVKKLLVAAGQSDLGAGRPGTEVALTFVRDLAIAPDGALLIGDVHRIWRLAPDGTLQTLVGEGNSYGLFEPPVEGLKGPLAGLRALKRLAVGPKGDVIMYEPGDDNGGAYMLRLAPDGIMHTMVSTTSTYEPVDMAFDPAGDPLVLDTTGKFSSLKQSKEYNPVVGTIFTPKYTVVGPLASKQAGRDAAGNLYVCDGLAIYKFDPAANKTTRVFDSSGAVMMDHLGNGFYRDAAGKLVVHTAAGNDLGLPTAGLTGTVGAYALAPDGVAYAVTDGKLVWRLGGGKAAVVAGGGTATDGQQAGSLAITALGGVAPLPNGDLIVGNGHQVQRVAADGKVTLLAGTAAGGSSTGDGGDPLAANFTGPRIVRADGAGNLYLADNLFDSLPTVPIRKLSADGKQLSTLFTPQWVADMVVATDGTLYWADEDAQFHYLVKRRKPDGTIETVTTDFFGRPMLAWMPGGELAIWPQASGKGLAWKDGVTRPLTMYEYSESAPSPRRSGDRPGNMAVDATGRFYFADTTLNAVYRWDPAADKWEKLAGGGARLLNGTSVDTSLDRPGYLAFGANGDLYIGDVGHKQVKKLAKADLQ